MKSVSLKINGVKHKFVVEEDMVLLDLLREELKLTGTKQGCDRKGQCGACTVIVNGKTVLSCLTKVVNLDDAEVISVEGLGTPDNPHLIQEAYVLSGAIQCGYCTPGLIIATKALLDKNPKPTRDEIRIALRNHLCRCTGYSKIIEAVELAGRFLRGETTPAKMRPDPNSKKIGVSHPRPWSMLKACGLAPFAADIIMPNALQLAVVASPHHNAKLKKLDTAKAEKMPGVVGIMTAKDIKGSNAVGSGKKLLFDVGDVLPLLGAHIAIVAANTRKEALAAAEAVKAEYEILPRMATAKEALAPGALEVQPGGNLCMARRQIKGDAKKALESSKYIVEADFSTQRIHQAPLEPEAGVAYIQGTGDDAELVVIGRSLRIHDHLKVLKAALGYEKVRYQEAFAGGQFGIKVDLTSEQIAGAAALHFKRPARYIPGTAESLRMTSKRHPYALKLRLGADEKGKITGYEVDATVEKGAFNAGAIVVVVRSLGMLSGAYNIPNVSAEVRMVYTNNIWGGAARGAGPPQMNYALESAMDLLAAKVGMDPLSFRQLNLIKPGEPGHSLSSGHVMEEWAIEGCLKKAKPVYEKALKEAAAFKSDTIKRGVGIGASSFGIGEAMDKSEVAVSLDEDNGLTVYASVADPGEGNDSMLSQIASHLTKIPLNKIRLQTRDTALTPVSAISAGSRQTFLSGHALVKAIEALQAAMKESGAKTHADLVKAGKPTRYQAKHAFTHTGLDEETGQGEQFISRCHGVQVAEVEVDTKSGEVRVIKMTGVVDAGTIINPLNVVGQIEGGMDMGAGMALREEYVHGETTDWSTYKFPTMKTSFDKDVTLIETPRKNHPLGATGIGEFTLMPTSPAIMNAIENAIGVRIYDLPATPDKVLRALKAKKS
ncbi:MAG: molybdopterin-dependent oxidoreductase [Dehalococcoidia bacterium]